MNSNERKYLAYLRDPAIGIKELFDYQKHRILNDIENKLNSGETGAALYDDFYDFYRKTPLYYYSSMHYELSGYILETILDYENANNVVIDKERIYFFRALSQIISSNTIGAISSWELANKEKSRVSGTIISVNSLIADLPAATIRNPINVNYSRNPIITNSITKYHTIIESNFDNLITNFSGIDSISLLSLGLKNVQAPQVIMQHSNTLELARIFGYELINNLCILNESTIKDYPEVSTVLTNKKDRQIGKMLAPSCLSTINPALSTTLGNSTSGYTGMYDTLKDLMGDLNFNTAYRQYINDLENNTYSIDEFKARILVCIHSLRNKVLHDFDDTLCFYNDADLFIKTIGLLFIGLNVTKKLRP